MFSIAILKKKCLNIYLDKLIIKMNEIQNYLQELLRIDCKIQQNLQKVNKNKELFS